MSVKEKHIYQFKITLADIKPSIWRRIQLPANSTFKDLHSVIQQAMGWYNCHLHQFTITNPKTGHADKIGSNEYLEDEDVIDEGKKKLAVYFSLENKKAFYEYDFGDGWEHILLLEKILPIEEGKKYPLCFAGSRACPPEDCGGVWGYKHLLEIIKDPNHPEYEEKLEWLGDSFDPEAFRPEEITLKS